MRFYAQFEEIPKVFLSQHKSGWLVFDRELCGPQGDSTAILLCLNRHYAFKARDALNDKEAK